MTPFTALPADVFLVVFQYLSIQDVLQVRETCRVLEQVTRERSLWHSIATTRSQQFSIPLLLSHSSAGDRDADHSPSALDLEHAVRRSVLAVRAFSSSNPQPAISTTLSVADGYVSRVTSLQFVSVNGKRYLFTANTIAPWPGVRSIECWDVDTSTTPACVARRHHEGGDEQRLRYVLNMGRESEDRGVLALSVETSDEILILGLSPNSQEKGFPVLKAVQKRVSTLNAFRDDTIVSRGFDPLLAQPNPRMWSVDNPDAEFELVDLHRSRGIEEITFEVLLEDEFVIVLRTQSVAIYSRESQVSPSSSASPPVTRLYPLVQHAFQWKIDSARLIRQDDPSESDEAQIGILLRFNSGFPWPVNLIHYFVLSIPLPFTSSMMIPAIVLPPPTLVQTIAAPVRLFGVPDMCIGRWPGSPGGAFAVWLDTHVEDIFQGGGAGQRLAGRLLTPTGGESGEEVDPEEGVEIVQVPLASGQTEGQKTSVYAIQEENTWIKVALDCRSLRIAVGTENGTVNLLGYA